MRDSRKPAIPVPPNFSIDPLFAKADMGSPWCTPVRVSCQLAAVAVTSINSNLVAEILETWFEALKIVTS